MIICGTGHRPDKLGGYSIEAFTRIVNLAADWLDDLGGDKRDELTIISGGALGWDQALAMAASRWGVPFHMYLPFEGFDSKWPLESRAVLQQINHLAEKVVYISPPGYEVWKMQKRNEAMVDAADLVLALWNGTPGGTANCIRYAEKVGKPIVNLWDKYNGTAI